jgi:hypothetical protein
MSGSLLKAFIEVLAPQSTLRETKQRATALRTHLLVMSIPITQLVAEPKLLLDRRQIPNHHR